MAGQIDYWELLSIANVALVEAAQLWTGRQSFGTLAALRIRQRLLNAIRDNNRRVSHELAEQPPDPSETDEEGVYYVRDWIDKLPADEQKAVRFAYGIGTRKRTNEQIAKAMRLSKRAAAELIQSGLLRLRYMATVEQCDG